MKVRNPPGQSRFGPAVMLVLQHAYSTLEIIGEGSFGLLLYTAGHDREQTGTKISTDNKHDKIKNIYFGF